MVMKKVSQSPEPPLAIARVEKRKSEAAVAAFPADARIELLRVWPGATPYEPRVRAHPDRKGVMIVEGAARLTISSPPNIKAESISAASIAKLALAKEVEGHRAAHLPVNYKPHLIEKARRRAIARGKDIPNSVFAPDTRYIFHDTSFPWCTTGKVETEGGSCTGTMIGRRLMLTGSHCIKWTSNGAGWVKFTPSYYNGDAPFGVAWGERVIYWQKADGSDGLSDQETAFDYVVVVLDSFMGDLTGYTGYRTYSDSWNNGSYWQQIGYPGDLSSGERPAFFSPGAVTSVQSKSTSGQTGYVMGHFMDTAPGHSGGPYWGWWANEPWPRVVGTDSTSPNKPGNDTSGDNEAGGGPALSSLVSYARTNYP
jgi:V8-like Glu-specific endopeptidase